MGHTRAFGEKKKNQKVHNLKSNKRGNNDACAPQIILTWYIILLNFMTISKNVTELWEYKNENYTKKQKKTTPKK